MAKRNKETSKKEVKTLKHSWYKKWSQLTPEEKFKEKYNRKGRPVMFWPSGIMKTFVKDSIISKEYFEYIKDPTAYQQKKKGEIIPTLQVNAESEIIK